MPAQVRYLVADGYYSQKKWIDGVAALELFQIGKLRHDANLRWLYQGQPKPRGRKRLYDGKVAFNELSRFETLDQMDKLQLYTAVLNRAHFKRDWRIVYLVNRVGNTGQTALSLCAQTIVRFYRARFQIEFRFRDAKPFLGLNHCQVRCRQALLFHFNASMSALNLIKLQDRQLQSASTVGAGPVISIASWKIRPANAHLLERFSFFLGLDFRRIKSRPDFEPMCNYGVIAA